MQEMYLKQAKTISLIIALLSLLQALLAIIGFVSVLLTLPAMKVSQTIIREALINTSINIICFLLFTVLFFVVYRRLRKGVTTSIIVQFLYIAYMIFSVILGIVNGGFSLQGVLVPLMLIILGIASAYSIKKVERH
ncbi:hypothetical protein HB912_04815 [Listeria aquatica]|uniref:Uncharacterized protein n=2 Tax=Listeria aquatica TaxID=1494960 RepID=A0A841ZLH8_9LIST|nr:hypothetical protein [Listeria aquatica]